MAVGLGETSAKSAIVPFSHSTYYNEEMGDKLFRQWVVFEKILPPDCLPELKIRANEIEKRFLNETGGRRINMDPGLLSLHNLVLASTKSFAHRIHLDKGIHMAKLP